MLRVSETDLNYLGTVAKAHGTAGGILIESTGLEKVMNRLEIVYLCFPENQWIPYRVENIRIQRHRKRKLFFVKLEGIETRTKAEMLKDHEVLMDQKVELEKVDISIIGYKVVKTDFSILGEVSEVLTTPVYSILVVQSFNKRLMIPWIDEFVSDVIDEKQQIRVRRTTDLEEME